MTFGEWLVDNRMTYREAALKAGLSHAAIGHIATGARCANQKTAKALERLGLPRSVKIWIARQTAASLDREREWWSNWAQHDLVSDKCEEI